MTISTEAFIGLAFVFFVIASLYASAGFGGGSGYLAILALFFTEFFFIRSTALVCNVVVVSLSSYLYYRKGLLDFKRFLPFILAGVPLAFLGALFRLKEQVFFIILGIALILSALAVIYQTYQKKMQSHQLRYRPFTVYLLGGAIGFLAGGWLGSSFTMKKVKDIHLKRWVAVLILFVGFRVLIINGLNIDFLK